MPQIAVTIRIDEGVKKHLCQDSGQMADIVLKETV